MIFFNDERKYMSNETKIQNKETIFGGTVKNSDGSPVEEVVKDGEKTAEIRNKETIFGGTVKNSDGSPVKEVVAKK
jgi:hypothetical protein